VRDGERQHRPCTLAVHTLASRHPHRRTGRDPERQRLGAERSHRRGRGVRRQVDREARHLDRSGKRNVRGEAGCRLLQDLCVVVAKARNAVGDPLGGANQRTADRVGAAQKAVASRVAGRPAHADAGIFAGMDGTVVVPLKHLRDA